MKIKSNIFHLKKKCFLKTSYTLFSLIVTCVHFWTEFRDNFLIVAASSRHNLYQVGVNQQSGMFPLLRPSITAKPVAVAFDPVNRDVYWSDVDMRRIAKFSLTTRRVTNLIVDHLGS